ncbi:MAG: endonuclease/exonuclease/phosphatase family protein [Candidatus Zixiibacteriota bacterium]
MNHGALDKTTAKGLKVLRERIAKAKIPSSKLDETLNIATWNIREFGKKARLSSSIHYIAEIINQFDIVAIVELRDNLRDLEKVMQILGRYWKVVVSDYTADRGGNLERIAYLYDKRAAVFTGLAAEPDGPRKKDKKTQEYLPEITWWRSPYMASFRAGHFDFIMLSAHIRWGSKEDERLKPLKMLAEWVYKRCKSRNVYDNDFIVMGDFNIPSINHKLYKAVTSKGLHMPKGLLKKEFGSNLAKDKRYDQILHTPMHESLFTEFGGVVDFYGSDHKPLFPGRSMTKTEFTYQLSDHLPLWIQLKIDSEDIKLNQILNKK